MPIIRKPLRPLLLTLLFTLTSLIQIQLINIEQVFRSVENHLTNAVRSSKLQVKYPRSYNFKQSLVTVKSSDWTSGFFPGCLWYMYEYSKDSRWKVEAERWNAGLEEEKNNTNTHDLGFMLYCSFGNGYRLTGDTRYKEILLQGAKSLASRFNPTVGSIRSWDHGEKGFPVIVDNMMNLELLFWAAKESMDKRFYHIAVTHANNTLKNHYRENGSSYHVVDYDPKTGKIKSRTTAQGYSNESSWARGQAWGLYGFTMTYRETRDKTYLIHAEKIADYFIGNLPKNNVPYWDFNAPNIPFEVQDASAAAIAASALVELSQYSEKNSAAYLNTAEKILISLSSTSFFAGEKTNGNFVLMHSVGSKPDKSEVDVPLIFADYYFLEALLRHDSLKKSKK